MIIKLFNRINDNNSDSTSHHHILHRGEPTIGLLLSLIILVLNSTICFITKSMQHISSNAEPAIPSLLRTKNLCHPYQNQYWRGSQDISGLRLSLDSNIQSIYQQIKRNPLKKNSGIPRLNQELVKEYIRFVYKQYNIRDPLSNTLSNNKSPNTTRIDQNCLLSPKNSHRKAVHLKENFLIEMLSESDHNQSTSRYQQQSFKRRSTQLSSPKKQSQRDSQIKQSYRYCFICQQPILERNIEIHEKKRCPQFRNLYSMSIGQLREILLRKINKIKKVIQSYLSNGKIMGNQTLNGFLSIQSQAIQYLDKLNQSLFQHKRADNGLLGQRNQVRYQFNRTMETFETSYFQMHAQLRKLQWFVDMYWNLQYQYGHTLAESDCVPYRNGQNTSPCHF